MAESKVLDASAILAYFLGASGCEKMKQVFGEAVEHSASLFVSAVNWGEVLYTMEWRFGSGKKDEAQALMEQLNLELVPAGKEAIWQASHLKANHRLPYADCFAAALAMEKKAVLVTADKDFKVVEDLIKILWI